MQLCKILNKQTLAMFFHNVINWKLKKVTDDRMFEKSITTYNLGSYKNTGRNTIQDRMIMIERCTKVEDNTRRTRTMHVGPERYRYSPVMAASMSICTT